MGGIKSNFGRTLCREWGIQARGYFDKNGKWYTPPISFPVALCDPKGYILFKTQKDLLDCGDVSVGQTIHIICGISKLPGYVKKR